LSQVLIKFKHLVILNKTVIINYGMNKNDIFTGKFIKKIST